MMSTTDAWGVIYGFIGIGLLPALAMAGAYDGNWFNMPIMCKVFIGTWGGLVALVLLSALVVLVLG
jgi:hypothetical protein